MPDDNILISQMQMQQRTTVNAILLSVPMVLML